LKKSALHKNRRPCNFQDRLAETVFNSLPAHVAVIDSRGIIIAANRTWQDFARAEGAHDPHGFVGRNYLDVCDAATGEQAEEAHAAAAGIRAVMAGDTEEFLYDYPCHTRRSRHWFYMRAMRLKPGESLHVLISHEDITALKRTEEALHDSYRALKEKSRNLEQANIALKVILGRRDEDKLALEQKVLSNIKNLVFPYLEKLKRAPLRPRDKANVDIIETRLNDVISPLVRRLNHLDILLTPQEMQVAALVKDGKSSKEIADILTISETTVHFHRKNLRDKLGLKNKMANLRAHLMSLA
jgi:DNA-binding CsgD family transcriptional regulator